MLGETIGGYDVIGKLGEGGMGAVYVAEHTLLGRRAAVKVLLPDYCRNQEYVERFFNEARAAAAIKHPGIVEIYDFGHRNDGSAYIVMELLEGEGLSVRIERHERLSDQVAVSLGGQIASVLAAAHADGIIHRDLKPDNVFLIGDPDMPRGERVKLLDFGIAKLSDEHKTGVKTRTGLVLGTPTYMSPEQCKGSGAVSHQSDLYSLGCIMFEMLSGQPPFQAEGVGEVIAKHIYEPAPAIQSLVPSVSRDLAKLVTALLSKSPEKRPADAAAVRATLGALLSATTHPSALEVRTGPAPPPPPDVGRFKTTLSTSSVATPSQTPETVAPARPSWLLPALAVVLLAAVGVTVSLIASSADDGERAEVGTTDDKTATSAKATEPPAIPELAPDAGVVEKATDAGPISSTEEIKVSITSTPPNAEVLSDEVLLGTTPLDLKLNPADLPFDLVLRKAGYEVLRRSIAPRADDTLTFELAEKQTQARRPSRPRRPERSEPSPTPPPRVTEPAGEGKLNPFDKSDPKPNDSKPNPFDKD